MSCHKILNFMLWNFCVKIENDYTRSMKGSDVLSSSKKEQVWEWKILKNESLKVYTQWGSIIKMWRSKFCWGRPDVDSAWLSSGDVGCGGLEHQRFRIKAMKLLFRTPTEPVIKLLASGIFSRLNFT
jgi:hypothetical protein